MLEQASGSVYALASLIGTETQKELPRVAFVKPEAANGTPFWVFLLMASGFVGVSIGYSKFVDWIEQAGYPVKRIDNHIEWTRQFEARLRALPEDKRQRSSINVLASLSHPYPAHERLFGSQHFQEAVRKLPGGLTVPHLDQAFILKCLDDLRRLGLIPQPAVRETAVAAG